MVAYIGEKTGLFRPIEGSEPDDRKLTVEYGLSVISCVFMLFCFILHPNSMQPSLFKTISRALDMTSGEMRLFDTLRAIHELESRIGLSTGTSARYIN